MGSELMNPTNKRRFDLSMSRRTRKPLNNLIKETHQIIPTSSSLIIKNPPDHDDDDIQLINPEREREREGEREREREETDRGSLNQLMRRVEEEASCEGSGSGSGSGSGTGSGDNKSSLGQHFSEEEKQMQMQLVKKNDKSNGVKFRGMMGRYVKVLSNVIKAKHDGRLNSSRKKSILRFKT